MACVVWLCSSQTSETVSFVAVAENTDNFYLLYRVHIDYAISRYWSWSRRPCDNRGAQTSEDISCMKASLTSALLNSSHRTHSAIIIARTVTGQAPIDGQGATAWLRCPTHTITLHKAALYDLYFAHSHLPYSSQPWWRVDDSSRRGGRGAWWVASTPCHLLRQHHSIDSITASCPVNRGVRIVKVDPR